MILVQNFKKLFQRYPKQPQRFKKKSDKRIRGYSIGHRSQRMIQWTFYQKKKPMIIIKIMD